MKHCWIRRDNTEEVLAVFLGWGADGRCLSQMPVAPCDVVAFYDYADFHTEVDLSSYKNIDIAAWSMGVFNAEYFLSANGITPRNLTAIAGTGRCIDDAEGLAVSVVDATYNNVSAPSLRKFAMRMCGGREGYVASMPMLSERDAENQKNELGAIMQRYAHRDNVATLTWDKAYITSSDLIFMPENQRRYWQNRAKKIIEIDCPHFPFLVIRSWDLLR